MPFAIHLRPIVCAAAALGAATAHAARGDYLPIGKGEEPQPVPAVECRLEKEEKAPPGPGPQNGGTKWFACPGKTKETPLRLKVAYEPAGATLDLLDARGRSLLPSPVFNNQGPAMLGTIHSADLNGDGKPDVVVPICIGGCGLAASYDNVTVFLSDGDTYKAWDAFTYGFSPKDLVRLRKDGPVFLITSDLCYASDQHPSKDGKNHNFWRSRLYRFDKAEMVADDKADPRFPALVQYKFAPHHKETDLLSPAAKRQWMAEKEADEPLVVPAPTAKPDGVRNFLDGAKAEITGRIVKRELPRSPGADPITKGPILFFIPDHPLNLLPGPKGDRDTFTTRVTMIEMCQKDNTSPFPAQGVPLDVPVKVRGVLGHSETLDQHTFVLFFTEGVEAQKKAGPAKVK